MCSARNISWFLSTNSKWTSYPLSQPGSHCFPSNHWYLAIIHQPGHTLRSAQPPNPPVTRKRKRSEELSVDSTIETSGSRKTLTASSTPHGSCGPSVVGASDTAPEAPTVEMEDSFDPGAIDKRSLYGPAVASSRTYGNKKPRASAPANLEGDFHGGVPLET
jgi:hypothetical protein